jgi:hypothetical protein
MSTPSSTALILDFAEYRARRVERAGRAAANTARRFLWGWPGQMMLVDFPIQAKEPSIAGRLRGR